jgi:hypothetical protein
MFYRFNILCNLWSAYTEFIDRFLNDEMSLSDQNIKNNTKFMVLLVRHVPKSRLRIRHDSIFSLLSIWTFRTRFLFENNVRENNSWHFR